MKNKIFLVLLIAVFLGLVISRLPVFSQGKKVDPFINAHDKLTAGITQELDDPKLAEAVKNLRELNFAAIAEKLDDPQPSRENLAKAEKEAKRFFHNERQYLARARKILQARIAASQKIIEGDKPNLVNAFAALRASPAAQVSLEDWNRLKTRMEANQEKIMGGVYKYWDIIREDGQLTKEMMELLQNYNAVATSETAQK